MLVIGWLYEIYYARTKVLLPKYYMWLRLQRRKWRI